MTKEHHQHDHGHHGHEHHEHGNAKWHWHRDWRTWVGVVLMLAAMFAYWASFDESLQPGKPAQQEMPAAP